MAQKIFVAFLWHQHQPYYKDLRTNKAAMPWVRLHGTKDYYDMAAILDSHPKIRMTFNLVPSLLVQLDDIARGTYTDAWLEKTLIPAKDFSQDDKVFVLENFFYCNWENMLFVYPRFAELFERRGHFPSREKIRRSLAYFSTQDFLDLQVWFNLAWMDPYWQENDPDIARLVKKGRGFTEEEKKTLMLKQKEICGAVAGKHKELWDKGQIEVSTTPFYHPILPLLCDTNVAQMSMPGSPKPRKRFAHPEDAEHQVGRSLEYMEKTFQRKPRGMWPSEGSVSEEVVGILARSGLGWAATDEGVLFRSLDREKVPYDRSVLYQPFWAETSAGQKVQMVFRDHGLSDSIGFVYSRMDPARAAEDFVHRIEKIADSVPEREDPPLLSVILDGENCWEYFQRDGRDFLNLLYGRFANHPRIETTTIGGFTERYPARKTLRSLWAGSWINHDFAIWIGHPEDNRAWDLLSDARDFLANASKNKPADDPSVKQAWESLYIAEGSDWCWWYGDQNSTPQDAVFDQLYRTHLKNVYLFMGEEPPQKLDLAIKGKEQRGLESQPLALISPKIDGVNSTYYEWRAAGSYLTSFAGGTMHQASHVLAAVYYGFDTENLYLRLDTERPLKDLLLPATKFKIDFIEPHEHELQIFWDSETLSKARAVHLNAAGRTLEIKTIAAKKIIEVALPFSLLGVEANDPVELAVTVLRESIQAERWPYQSSIRFKRPKEDFGSDIWAV